MAATSYLTQADELRLAGCVEKFFFDPLGFAEWAFPWDEPGTKLADFPNNRLEEWQVEYLAEMGRQLLAGKQVIEITATSGHGVGKTALVAIIIIWFMATRPDPEVVVTANTAAQLTGKTWRELDRWRQMCVLGDLFEWSATTYKMRARPSTWFAQAVPWSEHRSEAFQGTHETYVLMIFDEASSIVNSIWAAGDGAMTTGNVIRLAFGNPTRPTGRFRDCFRPGSGVTTFKVNAEKVRRTNKELFKRWEERYGRDSDYYRVRVLGEFPNVGPTQLIGNDLVDQARERKIEEWAIDPSTPLLMGIDVARQGDDRSVFRFRRGPKLYFEKRVYQVPNLMHLASYAAEILANGIELEGRKMRVDIAFVDIVGLGAGVYDRLVQLGHDNVIPVSAGERAHEDKTYKNKRTEMWARVRAWLPTADIPANDGELQEDLIGPEYDFDDKMRMRLEDKDDMKARIGHSPDDGDAVSLTFAEAVPSRAEIGGFQHEDAEPEHA